MSSSSDGPDYAGTAAKSVAPPPPPPPASRTDSESQAGGGKAKTHSRPRDVADWKRDDYYSAKQAGDRQLLAAVAYLGQQYAGNENAAELLAKLIESPTDDPFLGSGSAPASRNAKSLHTQLTETIVTALATNGSARARRTLEEIVSGDLNALDPQAAASAALRAIAMQPDSESNDILVRIIAGKQSVAATVDSEKLRGVAIELVAGATESVRMRVAERMVSGDVPQAIYDRLWARLKEPRAENIAAQIVLYRNEQTDHGVAEYLDNWFLAMSNASLSRLSGLNVKNEKRSVVNASALSLNPRAVAKQLWSERFASVVEHRMMKIDSLESGKRLVLLAASLPCPAARDALLRTLMIHRDEDPNSLGLETAEPGVLLVLKELPRKDQATTDAGVVRTSTAKTGKMATALRARQEHEKIAGRWLDCSQQVLRLLCSRFRKAAAANLAIKDLGVKLHHSAEGVVAYRFDWPEHSNGDGAGDDASAFRVRYSRSEQHAQPAKVLAYYRRQVPNAREWGLKDGVWLDSVGRAPDGKSSRSVDVLLTRPSRNVSAMTDQEQRVIVEVLTVECAAVGAKRVEAGGIARF